MKSRITLLVGVIAYIVVAGGMILAQKLHQKFFH